MGILAPPIGSLIIVIGIAITLRRIIQYEEAELSVKFGEAIKREVGILYLSMIILLFMHSSIFFLVIWSFGIASIFFFQRTKK